jgi:hypothetical protein
MSPPEFFLSKFIQFDTKNVQQFFKLGKKIEDLRQIDIGQYAKFFLKKHAQGHFFKLKANIKL